MHALETDLMSLQSSLHNESKSSMGDKYETSREMISQEINKVQRQLNEWKLNHHSIGAMDFSPTTKIKTGSLVRSDNTWYFIMVSLGKINFNAVDVYCISPVSPVGQSLIGLQTGDTFQQQGKIQWIHEIL